MRRPLILFVLAVPLCLVARTFHLTATTFILQMWNMALVFFRLLLELPEAEALLVAGLCCFLLAWLFHRRGMKMHAR